MDQWDLDRETCEKDLALKPPSTVNAHLNDEEMEAYNAWWDRDTRLASAARTRWPAALDRIAELEAERDAAYAKGWEDAKRAAVDAVEMCAVASHTADPRYEDPDYTHGRLLMRDAALDAIRAVEPKEKP